MTSRERHLILEEIASSSDPSVSAGDRLRALELLAELEEEELDRDEESEDTGFSDDDSQADWDRLQAEIVLAILEGDEEAAADYPATAEALWSAVEERVRELGPSRADFTPPAS